MIKRLLKSSLVTKSYIRYIKYKYKIRLFLKEELNDYYTKDVKSRVKAFGNESKINGQITILFPKSIFIGSNVHIGEGCFLDGRGGIIIGDNTHISRNVTIYSTNHNYEGELLPYDHKYVAKEVIIGKNVWIGMNVCITPGVHIGDGAIIGLGAVISKNINAGEIVVSGQQRVIGQRNMEEYNRKEINKLYGGVSGFRLSSNKIDNYLVSPFKAEKIVFVLSTGRSGSTSMARMFESNLNISAFHETFYFMLGRLSIEYITGHIKKEEAKRTIVDYFQRTTIVKPGTIYLESDQKLAPFIEILNEIFDHPKFIWLIRHPKTFMHSAVSRGWFMESSPEFVNGHVLVDPLKALSRTRITGDLVGEYSTAEWKALDQREKVLWYWRYWNKQIEMGLNAIPRDRVLIVKMENLQTEYKSIMNYIGLEVSEKRDIVKANPVMKKDIDKYRRDKFSNYQYFMDYGYKFVKEEMEKMGYNYL